MKIKSTIYRGTVAHARKRPKPHRLDYSVFALLLDIDELVVLDKTFQIFGYNRWAPLAFYDRDHGPLDGSALRPWIENKLREANIEYDGGGIQLLCYPRILGYVFNPLSTYFCYQKNGDLAAILYEVCNTHHERHTYIIPVSTNQDVVIKQNCRKALYVSPFISMDATYYFRIVPPGDTIRIVIREEDNFGLLLAASFSGQRFELTSRSLTRCLLGFPLLTTKIAAAIHWEALKLWLKGLKTFRHQPALKQAQTSIGEVDTDK